MGKFRILIIFLNVEDEKEIYKYIFIASTHVKHLFYSFTAEKRRQTSAERMQGFRQGQHEKQMLDNAVVAPPQNGYKHVDSGQSNKIPSK